MWAHNSSWRSSSMNGNCTSGVRQCEARWPISLAAADWHIDAQWHLFYALRLQEMSTFSPMCLCVFSTQRFPFISRLSRRFTRGHVWRELKNRKKSEVQGWQRSVSHEHMCVQLGKAWGYRGYAGILCNDAHQSIKRRGRRCVCMWCFEATWKTSELR